MLKISTNKLMLVAGIVWAIAGANIANIGLTAYRHDWGWVIWALLVGSAVIFVLFHSRIWWASTPSASAATRRPRRTS